MCPLRSAAADKCDCDKLDFVAAKSLNKEGLDRFIQDRTVIAALNDRLVRFIELVHCLEEENESLEHQILELEERLNSRPASSSVSPSLAEPDYSLDAVVERLRRERDDILCHTDELQRELERLMADCEKTVQQKILIQQERKAVAEEVDAVTVGCLALREQVAIYEEQLASMEAQHKTAVEGLLEPAEGTTGAMAAIKFGSPDVAQALDVKKHYCQLAESLQYECGVVCSAAVHSADGKRVEVGGTERSSVNDLPQIKDVSEMKILISELQKELAELEKHNEELEDKVEMKTATYMDEISELERTAEDMQSQEADFKMQMKEQCEDYKELLCEKMARDMEIAAYRGLVEEEEERLCYL
ncbi:uncharacterized protein V6R79_023539 [Siganus canaliculatus]